MEVKRTLRMKKGQDSSSYARNSLIQSLTMLRASPILKTAIEECLKNTLPESMGIADLGCASGPNTLMLISNIVNFVRSTCSKMGVMLPELRVSLNDLPSNDFNTIFKSLPEFYDNIKRTMGIGNECFFVSGVAGSFYGRLFPAKSLHFVHSASSLHWLSRVPDGLDTSASEHLNKGNVHISKTSPRCVLKAYISQFKIDLFTFLRSRSEEMVEGGIMVLANQARSQTSIDSAIPLFEIMSRLLMSMASEGRLDEEKIDAFNFPYYTPSLEELQNMIKEEGSFSIVQQEFIEVACEEVLYTGQEVLNTSRAVFEPLLESHFGSAIVDDLFARMARMNDEDLLKIKVNSSVTSMVRK